MKKRWICIFLASVFIILCSCSKTDTTTPSGMKLISLDAVDYYMYVPDSWVQANQDGVTCAYASGAAGSSNVTCARYAVKDNSIFNMPQTNDEEKEEGVIYAENYWADYVSSLESLPGYRLLSGPAKTTLNRLAAVRCVFSLVSSGTEYKVDMVICIKEKMYAYLLTYTSEAEKYDTYIEDYNKILEEFVFQTGVLK